METVILKTGAVVDSDQNIKNYVFKNLGNGTLSRITIMSPYGESTTMIVYNSEAIASGAGTVELDSIYTEGNDVVRVYSAINTGTTTWLTVTFSITVTKVLLDSKGAKILAECRGNSISEKNVLGANLKNLAMHIPTVSIGNTFGYQYSCIYGELADILNLIALTKYGISCSQDITDKIHGKLSDIYRCINLDTTKWQTVTFRGSSVKRYFLGIRDWDIEGDAYDLTKYLASQGLRNVGVGWSTTGTHIKYKTHWMRGASYTTWINGSGNVTCWNGDTDTGW